MTIPSITERDALEPSSLLGINPRDRGFVPLDSRTEFGNDHPLALEIGSGKGSFLIRSAEQLPGINWIGIEKSLHYYRIIVNRLEKRSLINARIVNFDAEAVVKRMLPDETVDQVHIYFPDPWPRKKEKKRRIAREQKLLEIRRTMKPDAWGVFATDHREYFESAVPEFEKVFAIQAGELTAGEPRTNYEAKYREEGRPIYEIRFGYGV
ncbi:MAG: hypothetical protein KY459_15325 [Acidobacteria bacterium]|nr:hypothetical protein [Acidobacteriota bacterium]